MKKYQWKWMVFFCIYTSVSTIVNNNDDIAFL